MTSPGTRREKRRANFASAHCRRDHVSPSVSRCSSVVSGKLSSTAKASLFAKRSSFTCADGTQPALDGSALGFAGHCDEFVAQASGGVGLGGGGGGDGHQRERGEGTRRGAHRTAAEGERRGACGGRALPGA